MSGRKKLAILVGCSYFGTGFERYGCENDVSTIEDVLRNRFGFNPGNIAKLIETNTTDSLNQPTKLNIENALRDMRKKARMGDVLFFYLSGLVRLNESDKPRAILSCDLKPVSATEFKDPDNQLPKNTIFTLVLESSHSAGFIDPMATDDFRILFSACKDNETDHRVDPKPHKDRVHEYGVFTKAIKLAVRDHPLPIINEKLLEYVNLRIGSFNKPAQPAEPAQPIQPAQPAQPAQPIQPAQPAQPARPIQPAEPAQPAQPAQPAEPAQGFQQTAGLACIDNNRKAGFLEFQPTD